MLRDGWGSCLGGPCTGPANPDLHKHTHTMGGGGGLLHPAHVHAAVLSILYCWVEWSKPLFWLPSSSLHKVLALCLVICCWAGQDVNVSWGWGLLPSSLNPSLAAGHSDANAITADFSVALESCISEGAFPRGALLALFDLSVFHGRCFFPGLPTRSVLNCQHQGLNLYLSMYKASTNKLCLWSGYEIVEGPFNLIFLVVAMPSIQRWSHRA